MVRAFAHGAMGRWIILHRVDSLSYFSFQPVIHDWCNKGRGMCHLVCGMMYIKEPLLLIRIWLNIPCRFISGLDINGCLTMCVGVVVIPTVRMFEARLLVPRLFRGLSGLRQPPPLQRKTAGIPLLNLHSTSRRLTTRWNGLPWATGGKGR